MPSGRGSCCAFSLYSHTGPPAVPGMEKDPDDHAQMHGDKNLTLRPRWPIDLKYIPKNEI